MDAELQRNSGYRGTVGTEEQWVQRNGKYRGTEEQWVQRDSRYRGTEVQRNSGFRGTEEQWVQGTEEPWMQRC